VLDYKAGADGAIAGSDVMRSAPDGYTLLFGTNTGMCAAPRCVSFPPYDPLGRLHSGRTGRQVRFRLRARERAGEVRWTS